MTTPPDRPMRSADRIHSEPDVHQAAMQHIFECETCSAAMKYYFIRAATSVAGSQTSEAKANSSRENGKLGGRPKKVKE